MQNENKGKSAQKKNNKEIIYNECHFSFNFRKINLLCFGEILKET